MASIYVHRYVTNVVFVFFVASISFSMDAREYAPRYAPGADALTCNSTLCYSSQEVSASRYIPPLHMKWKDLKSVIRAMPRVWIVRENKHYILLHLEGSSLGVVHKVEFFRDRLSDLIHVRSSSDSAMARLKVKEHQHKVEKLYYEVHLYLKKQKKGSVVAYTNPFSFSN